MCGKGDSALYECPGIFRWDWLNDWWTDETGRSAALRYSLERGGRSGRVARQFANEWIGRVRLGETPTPEGPGRPVGR